MSTITFNNAQYDCKLIERLVSEGHEELVDANLIVDTYAPTNTSKLDTFRSKTLLAYKHEGKYHIFQGSINPKANKLRIVVITKFTLKKCKVDQTIPKAAKYQVENLPPTVVYQKPRRSYQDSPRQDYNRSSTYPSR